MAGATDASMKSRAASMSVCSAMARESSAGAARVAIAVDVGSGSGSGSGGETPQASALVGSAGPSPSRIAVKVAFLSALDLGGGVRVAGGVVRLIGFE